MEHTSYTARQLAAAAVIADAGAARRLPQEQTQETVDAACHLILAKEHAAAAEKNERLALAFGDRNAADYARRTYEAAQILARARARWAEAAAWMTLREKTEAMNTPEELAALAA